MARRFKHLTKSDRLMIEKLLKQKQKKKDIAKAVGVDESTIYREIKRGKYTHRNSDWTEEERYSPDIAHNKYRENLKAKGPGLKIDHDRKLADHIEKKIAEDGYSPEAVLGEIKRENLKFDAEISKTTLYRYIDIGLFRTITNEDLPVKPRKKKKVKKVRKKQARASAGESIEKRPDEIDTREEFGHWEMDTVMGKRGESLHSLLVMTERKTRDEILMLLNEHTAEQVVCKIDALEKEWGDRFSTVFKTITVDNGTEFSDCAGLERSVFGEKDRTKLYYCHPYSSYERGSNENQNRLVRRKIPKGTNFDSMTEEDIQKVQDWINNYPRGIFEYETSKMRFEQEVAALA
ncbi:MAG: IS30 family transposase [Clostridia bacterium]|nr:IS30 family transposase [Clostridia bacterium]